MIPDCITINDRQKEKLEKFAKWLNKNYPFNNYDDVSMASTFTWSIFSTGLGNNIEVESRGYWCCLTVGDDGEVIDTDEDYDWMEK